MKFFAFVRIIINPEAVVEGRVFVEDIYIEI